MNVPVEHIHELKQEVSEMKADIHQIKDVIIGNEEFRQAGLVDRIIALEAWRSNLTLRIATISGGATVLIILGNKIFEYLGKKI